MNNTYTAIHNPIFDLIIKHIPHNKKSYTNTSPPPPLKEASPISSLPSFFHFSILPDHFTTIPDGNNFLSCVTTFNFPKHEYSMYVIVHSVHCISVRRCWIDVNKTFILYRHWWETFSRWI
jgi:hypothetical protein